MLRGYPHARGRATGGVLERRLSFSVHVSPVLKQLLRRCAADVAPFPPSTPAGFCSGSPRVVVHSRMRRNALIILGFAALAWGVAALALNSPSLTLLDDSPASGKLSPACLPTALGSLGGACRHRSTGIACAGNGHRQPGHADQLPRRARGTDPRRLGRRLAQRRARGAPARVLAGRRRELRAGARPSQAGERVSVRAAVGPSGRPVAFQFHIDTPYPTADTTDFANLPAAPADYQSFYTLPGMHPPVMTVTTPDRDPAAGDIFTTNGPGPGQYGPLIYTPQGRLVWFDALPQGEAAEDLNVQTYEGRRVLTWWRGHVLSLGFGEGEDVVMNSRYQTIARVVGGNGLKADLHDFQLAPRRRRLHHRLQPDPLRPHLGRQAIGERGDRRHGRSSRSTSRPASCAGNGTASITSAPTSPKSKRRPGRRRGTTSTSTRSTRRPTATC